MGNTPCLAAKARNASPALELLRDRHGRPTPERENFDLAEPTPTVALRAGTIELHGDGVAFSVKEEKETGAGDGGGTAAGLAPASYVHDRTLLNYQWVQLIITACFFGEGHCELSTCWT